MGEMVRWDRCVFQSIERQDQLIFALLGGMVAHLGARCRLWDAYTGLCGCGAPEALMGRNHTVVEMGANDGLHMSNSYFFSKTLGWRALLIEGNPDVYASASPSTGPRPSASTPSWATPSTSRPTGARPSSPFTGRVNTEKHNTALDWETGLSGIPSPNSSTVALRSVTSAQRAAARFGVEFRQHRLRRRALLDAAERAGIGKIDVLFLDVEGAELSVLQTLNFQKNPVRFLVVERPTPMVTRLLQARGYDDLRLTYDSGGDRVFHNGLYF